MATRRDARFCSDGCRKASSRAKPPLSPDSKSDMPAKPRTQFAHNIATAEAYIAWRRDNYPRIEDME